MPGIEIVESKKKGTFNVYKVEIISSLFCTQFFGTEHTRFAYQCNNRFIFP